MAGVRTDRLASRQESDGIGSTAGHCVTGGEMKTIYNAVMAPLVAVVGIATALATILWMALPAGAASLSTEIVSVSSAGVQGNGESFPSTGPTSISRNGQFVVFASSADNLVAGDTNEHFDVFRRDRSSGQTVLVSVSSSGQQVNGDSGFPSGTFSISADGNLVAFDSETSNLVPGDTNRLPDVFVHDVATGETTRVSVTSSGRQAQGESFGAAISDDGRLAVFNSTARLVPEDTNRRLDVYARDLVTGQIRLVSVSSTGQLGNDDSFVEGSPSGDSRLVVFSSLATNLVPGDTNDNVDVFLRDLVTGQTTRVTVPLSGQGGGGGFQGHISANGRFVAFNSGKDDLVRHDTNGFQDVFVRDLKIGRTTRVSVSSVGEQGNDDSCCSKGISGDGRFVAYRSFASNLVPDDTNGGYDAFLFDRSTGQTVLASVSATGEQGVYPDPIVGSSNVSISEDGAWVLFASAATNFPPAGDSNGDENGDTFVRGPYGANLP